MARCPYFATMLESGAFEESGTGIVKVSSDCGITRLALAPEGLMTCREREDYTEKGGM